jgi:hypothetical protein
MPRFCIEALTVRDQGWNTSLPDFYLVFTQTASEAGSRYSIHIVFSCVCFGQMTRQTWFGLPINETMTLEQCNTACQIGCN